jgi:hypothetical protein
MSIYVTIALTKICTEQQGDLLTFHSSNAHGHELTLTESKSTTGHRSDTLHKHPDIRESFDMVIARESFAEGPRRFCWQHKLCILHTALRHNAA